MKSRNCIYEDITKAIGATPLVRINSITKEEGCGAEILAKLEFFNPLSSVKDRAALYIIEDAERAGKLKKGGTIIEATSGNTGIGLAYIASVKGYRIILTMPDNMSLERRKLLAYLGAKLVLTPADQGMTGAVQKAEELCAGIEGALFAKQFENPSNTKAHEETTAPEIISDTGGKLDAFIASVGTGGTLIGVAKVLKTHDKNIKIVAIEPEKSPMLSKGTSGLHGIQGIGANFIPKIIADQRGLIDEVITVSDEEAISYAQRLAKQEGIFAGISSGAAMCGAVKLAQKPDMKGKTIVTLFPDTGERYLSSALFE
ncbi:MAG: cysteine synthase A [Alphaproteobacteria bacterium]|nr:cysteine synthase A [Alphaproteobacteria bacterium]